MTPVQTYAIIGLLALLCLLTLAVFLVRSGPNGAAGAPINFAGFWAWLTGYRTLIIGVAYIAVRWAHNHTYLDDSTFGDLQELLIGGGAVTFLAKLKRQETKQDVVAAKVDTVVDAATDAAATAQVTQQTVKAALKLPVTPLSVVLPMKPPPAPGSIL